MATTTLHFEDRGQDFLEWDVDDQGVVVACRPFQEWVWNGSLMLDHPDFRIGTAPAYVNSDGQIRTLNYRIVKIERSE